MINFTDNGFGYKAEFVTTGRDVFNMMGYGHQALYVTFKIIFPNGYDIVETACFNPDCKPFWIPSKNHRHSSDLVNIIRELWGSEEIGTYYHEIVSELIIKGSITF